MEEAQAKREEEAITAKRKRDCARKDTADERSASATESSRSSM